MSENIYAVHYRTKEYKSDIVFQKRNQHRWVTIGEYGETTSVSGVRNKPPHDIKLWSSASEAEEFMKEWRGQSYWFPPSSWEIIKVIPKTKVVFSHYESQNE